jgi:hypothetical protein
MELEDECETMLNCIYVTKIDFGVIHKTILMLHHEEEMEKEKRMRG